MYTGGEPAQVLHRTIERGSCGMFVYRPVAHRAPLAFGGKFVQVASKPVSALPATIRGRIDFDPDGRPGVHRGVRLSA